MLNCTGDPFENYLKPFGYSVVVLPREDIHPLQLKAPQSSRRLEDIGTLGSIFAARDMALPPVISAATMDLSGQSSGNLNVGVGLKLFGSALAAVGLSPIGLSAGFDKAQTLSFQFGGVTRESVEFGAVDSYLAKADFKAAGPSVRALLDAGSLFVILAVLRASKINITASDSQGREAAIDVSALSGLLGGNIKVNPVDARSSTVSIDTGVPLAFGVKAVCISRTGNRYTGIKAPSPDDVVLEGVRLTPDEPVPAYAAPDLVF